MNEQVVITGAGMVNALGRSLPASWDKLASGKCGIRSIESFNAKGLNCTAAAEVNDLNAEELNVHPRDSRIMDKHAYMLLKASRESFSHAGLDKASVDPNNIGYFASMGMVDYNLEDLLPSVLKSLDDKGNLDYDKFYSGAYQEIHPLWPLSMLNNINFCQVAIDLGIRGENTTFAPHSDSAIHSIIEAYNAVLEKQAEVILAGGVSEKVSPSSLARASMAGILNSNDISCRPFGKNSTGTMLGEGCGIITIELLSHAIARQAPCLARISGYGSSFGSSDISNSATSAAISLSMETALEKAELKPGDIDLIIAHGDGAPEGDANEAEAIHNTFAGCLNTLHVYSSKAALGHLLSGASAVDVVIGTNILINGIIPAIFDSGPLEDNIALNLVRGDPLKADPARIMINSRSYEGQCASLIIEKWIDE